MAYLINFNGKVDMTPEQAAGINAAVESSELAYWRERPEHFSPAYYCFPHEGKAVSPPVYRSSFYPPLNEATVTTWQGSTLGTIIHAIVYRHNFGGRMVSLTVRGTNGATYHGRASWDYGNVVRLRKVKRS